ncbi:hypothetical protein EW026_g6557 [Hermanssonia centrifuga]|uniref:Cytochrome P450 n=1 Tax=Hermanssonia centrifuga TaxID=98765 RepID=A0A4S4KAL4_9APHY|nr:hypothetical protein EW026_g6557 [Hermanssonia centrifuga]
MVWIIRGGKQHIYIQKIHEKYGDAVRVGPNEISIRDPSAILPMMGAQGIPKGPALIAFRDSTEHARRRKPWNRAFNTTAIKEYQPIISKRVTQLVDRLAEQKGTVDLAKWISFFTYDFMGDMVYGGGTEMLRDGDKDGLWKALKDGLDIAQVYEHVPWLSYYTRHIPNASTELKQFRAMALNRTIERYKNGAMTKDLFYYLSNEDNAEKESPQPAVVISDGILALVAGSDTTAAVLSNTFWCLIRQPDAYKRLQAEVDQYYPRGEDSLDPKHHVKMVYLDAVL